MAASLKTLALSGGHNTATYSQPPITPAITVAYKEFLKIIKNIVVLLSMEFFCLLTFDLYGRHTKVNCVMDLRCQRKERERTVAYKQPTITTTNSFIKNLRSAECIMQSKQIVFSVMGNTMKNIISSRPWVIFRSLQQLKRRI
ncbi:hypothetical protein DAPPUDRAFT_105420 [Daphnia pulex]|uniref:Uncharacterized protein n=1 Tax=Daphnia pulex TaxID=6669 RepID=E9GQR1_DAPPU|nr:hypothetical protein DAPPUDRAFT_105420 [Daphnia pulex]|eukprot:EFX78158.1 hypothetical protein DAPPUDRAFT_105420 [Daphnia pulex]